MEKSAPYAIRRALSNESELLTEIAYNSKAYWGYDDKYMDRCRNENI